MKPEVPEDYLILSDWKPAELEGVEVESGFCTRCGDREATVSICVPCLIEVAAKMSAKGADPVPILVEEPPKKRRGRVLEWFFVALLSLGVLVTGSLLNGVLR